MAGRAGEWVGGEGVGIEEWGMGSEGRMWADLELCSTVDCDQHLDYSL